MRVGGPGYLSIDRPSHGRSCPPYPIHGPRSCRYPSGRCRTFVGFGFYESRVYCPSYYVPYYVSAPVYVVSSPPIVQETVVVSPEYAQPPVSYTPTSPVYGESYSTYEPIAGVGDTASTDVSPTAEPATPDTAAGQIAGEQLYVMMYEGTKQFSEGAYESAARMFLNVTLQDPANVDAALAYAIARFATGDYPVAAIAIRRGVSRLPEIVNSTFDIRERYGNPADLDRHLQALQTFLNEHPDHVDGLLVFGFVQHFTSDR